MNFIYASILSLAMSACSSASIGNITNKNIESDPSSPLTSVSVKASDIHTLNATRAVNVEYKQGNNTSVIVQAPEDIMEYIEVENRNGELYCGQIQGVNINKGMERVKITVTSPKLTSIDVTTAATINITGGLNLNNDELDIDATTAATVNIDGVQCSELECDATTASTISISGISCTKTEAAATTAATIRLSGNTDYLSAKSTTGSSIKASDLMGQRGSAEATTGGSIKCNVKELSTQSTTGGDVKNR
jgi:hypothetical protein